MTDLTTDEKMFIKELVEDMKEVSLYPYLLKLDRMSESYGRVIPYGDMEDFFGIKMEKLYLIFSPLMTEDYGHLLFTLADIVCPKCDQPIARIPPSMALDLMNVVVKCEQYGCGAEFIIDESMLNSNIVINKQTKHIWDRLIMLGRPQSL